MSPSAVDKSSLISHHITDFTSFQPPEYTPESLPDISRFKSPQSRPTDDFTHNLISTTYTAPPPSTSKTAAASKQTAKTDAPPSPPASPSSPLPSIPSIPSIMASSSIDQKYLGLFARNLSEDNPLLSSTLYKLLGLSVILTKQLIKARKLRKLDPTRQTKSLDLYFHILWLAREGLVLTEGYVLQMVGGMGELRVLANKIRGGFLHIFVLFHNSPSVTVASPVARQISTPPGLVSPRGKGGWPAAGDKKGKTPQGFGLDTPSPPESRSSSVQPSHPLEQGQWSLPPTTTNGHNPTLNPISEAHRHISGLHQHDPPGNFIISAQNFIPACQEAFQSTSALATQLLWGSHPILLSVKTEYCAFLYDCCKDYEGSRRLARETIREVYESPEGMDDEMFRDSAELVGVLGRMCRRGLGNQGRGGSELRDASGTGSEKTVRQLRKATPPMGVAEDLRGAAGWDANDDARRAQEYQSLGQKVAPPQSHTPSTPPRERKTKPYTISQDSGIGRNKPQHQLFHEPEIIEETPPNTPPKYNAPIVPPVPAKALSRKDSLTPEPLRTTPKPYQNLGAVLGTPPSGLPPRHFMDASQRIFTPTNAEMGLSIPPRQHAQRTYTPPMVYNEAAMERLRNSPAVTGVGMDNPF